VVDHTVKAYDNELDMLDRRIAQMGGIAEKMVTRLPTRIRSSPIRSSRPIHVSTRCSTRSSNSR